MARRLIQIIGAGIVIVLLTALTQLGGLVFFVSVLGAWLARRAGRARSTAALAGILFFAVALPILNLIVLPPLAALNGRVPLPCEATAQRPYAPLSSITCALGRNYARSEVASMLKAMVRDLSSQYPGITIAYLDAGFPLLDGFPLPPHLSHDDGRSIDLAYLYKDEAGYVPLSAPSLIGYWGFETPPADEPSPCADKVRWLTLRWDMGWFQRFVRKDLRLDEERTAAMLRWLVEKGPEHGVSKILLEPYMAKRLGVVSPLIRFQGCRAARHDDHIHVEVGS